MSGPKLLLADDSLTIQRVIGLTFANENVQVITVPDGDEAISRIAMERPDIVLADIGMPKRSGYDVAAFVKSDPSLAHIPVVLLAGAFEPIDDARARQAGSDGVLVKPFEPQHVIARVRELLAGARPPQPAPPPVALSSPVVPATAVEELAFDTAPPAVTAVPPSGSAPPSEPLDLTLDDYFDRLDAAFAELETGAAANTAPGPLTATTESREGMIDDAPIIPTLDELLSGLEPADAIEASVAEHDPDAHPVANLASVADVGTGFSSPEAVDAILDPLDALDLDLDPPDVTPRTAFSPAVAEIPVEPQPAPVAAAAPSDISVDALATRVLERLQQQAGGNLNDLVANVVSQVAERLIREEIDRIRRQ